MFEQLTREHGIRSITVDPNFKIGARSKKGLVSRSRSRLLTCFFFFFFCTSFVLFPSSSLLLCLLFPLSLPFFLGGGCEPRSLICSTFLSFAFVADPTVRVCGSASQQKEVDAAAAELGGLLDARTNRAVMRVDIPAEKHYFVIGKKVCTGARERERERECVCVCVCECVCV